VAVVEVGAAEANADVDTVHLEDAIAEGADVELSDVEAGEVDEELDADLDDELDAEVDAQLDAELDTRSRRWSRAPPSWKASSWSPQAHP